VRRAGPDTGLVEVRLLDFPLDVYERAREHNEELRREFALLALRCDEESGRHELPRRLTLLIEQLSADYAEVTSDANAQRDAAIERGQTRIDLRYTVPVSAARAVRTLDALLDEADEFCRAGEHLLTLATPPEAVRFRRWYLDEFVGQLETGRAPIPWSA
jgi:hypothetical protein